MIFSNYFQVELPEYWLEKPLQYLTSNEKFSFVDGPFGSDLKSEEYQDEGVPLIQLNNIKDGQHIFNTTKYISEKKKNILSRHVAFPNDVVIAKMAEPVARAALVSSKFTEYVIVADCVKLTPNLNKVNLQYLIWAINSDEVKRKAEQVSTGTTRIRINLGELKKLKIPFPPIQEQTKIAQFLDHETVKIDQLIEKQQTLIELLKEKRQAVISHAVTKGLDPNVKMKDSGVEWLGEVPEHWEVKKLKYLGDAIIGLTYSPDDIVNDETEGTLVLRSSNVQNKKLSFTDNVYVNKEIPQKLIVKLNDILICARNGSRALIGKNALITEEAEGLTFGAFMSIFRSQYNEYLFNVFNSSLFEYQSGTFLTATINQLTTGNLNSFEVPIPSSKEQIAITQFLKEQTSKIDLLIQKSEQQIELMKERRTALISAAVTGKIDVRDWQPEQ